jgi:hypothetical protein
VLFVGDDWAEAHHDIEIGNDEGPVVPGGGYRRAWRTDPRAIVAVTPHRENSGTGEMPDLRVVVIAAPD